MDTTQPKKRGRKPKNKLLLDETTNIKETTPTEITTDIIVPKKKRGRKPKPKPLNEVVKIPKKRGRKPKEIFKPVEPVTTPVQEEAIILHLNIKNKYSSILNIEDEFVKYNPEINIPIPFIPDDLNNAFYLEQGADLTGYDTGFQENPTTSNGITNDTGCQEDQSVSKDFNTALGDTYQAQIPLEKNVQMDIVKKNFNKDIYEKYNNKTTEYYEEFVSDKNKCLPIFVEFSEANKKNEWPTKTNIDCFWCCCSFENSPFGIPIKKVDDHYEMFGNYCSAECTASAIFESNLLNDSDKTNSYSLLNLLYKEKSSCGIGFAPSKLCLKRFGGRMSIEQYRNNLRSHNKTYSVIIPPLTSIIPNIEETNINKNMNNIGKSILTDSIVSRSGELLRLRRQKPLPDSNNTLEACMNLKML
jgi:hypothetical protein